MKAAWSLVGRSHYTDMRMLAGDARRSAEAVRKVLDRAEAELQELATQGDTALVTGSVAPSAMAAYSAGPLAHILGYTAVLHGRGNAGRGASPRPG